MNKPTEEQIREVLAGTSTPETARLVAQWFATDEGTDYLSRSMDCDVEQVKLGYEELFVDHEIASDELFARIRRNIRRKRVRRIVFRLLCWQAWLCSWTSVWTCLAAPATKKSMWRRASVCK